ncbi:hypothetical protein ACOMHN_043004 [Nucella lapillus]
MKTPKISAPQARIPTVKQVTNERLNLVATLPRKRQNMLRRKRLPQNRCLSLILRKDCQKIVLKLTLAAKNTNADRGRRPLPKRRRKKVTEKSLLKRRQQQT